MSHLLIRTEQCPKCALLGKDTNRDNLAVYSNGKWCFSCGYQESINGISKFKETLLSQPLKSKLYLPEDSCFNYPERTLDWIYQYELTITDLLNNNVVWSEYRKRLIFPVYGTDKDLIAFQGRYFGEEKKAKWFGMGNLKDTFNILGQDNKLILTEDVISAIKLSKVTMAMPLYGCECPSERFERLYKLFGYKFDIRIWLDPDMRPKALKHSRLGSLMGLKVSTIYSEADPKEIPYNKIKDFI